MSRDGLIIIDKPGGMTSHDVVDVVRRTLGTRKVGHGGTLDPDATGVLVIGIGRATRFLSYAQSAAKTYLARVRLGRSTSTQDASGEVLSERPVTVGPAEVARALEKLTGEIEQIPPMVSAVKVGGERLYKKALRGEEVERPARRVVVYELELIDMTETGGAPPAAEIELRVVCSGGTYVRTLAHDLGEMLGCGAHLLALRRTASGGFGLDESVALAELGPGAVRPFEEIVRDLPHVELDEASARRVADGRPLDAGDAPDAEEAGSHLALTAEGRLLAVYRREGDRLVADRVVGR